MTNDSITALASAIAALGTLAAVFVAFRALASARKTALLDRLVTAYGDMLGALNTISAESARLSQQSGGEARSRIELQEPFRAFQSADARVRLLAPALGIDNEYTSWVLDASNTLAANLLQADEFGTLIPSLMARRSSDSASRVGQGTLDVLDRSIYFYLVKSLISDLPQPPTPRWLKAEPIGTWSRETIEKFGDDGYVSVYNPEASYLIQSSRLLDDFTHNYLEPWCQAVVRRRNRG
jgi:hypothetical protein